MLISNVNADVFAPPLNRRREGPPSPLAALIIIIILFVVQRSWGIFRVLPVLAHLRHSVHKWELAPATQKTNICP